MSSGDGNDAPEASAAAALAFVEEGQTIGLGTGRAAEAFVHALGHRVKDGLAVRGVPTSERTAALAGGLGIPLLTLAEAGRLDVTFDGADEVDPQLDLIKGYGGALVREKIVAASSDRLVILVGDEKLVDAPRAAREAARRGDPLRRRARRANVCAPSAASPSSAGKRTATPT